LREKQTIAERLVTTVRLGEIKVGSENQITSLNFDPNQLTIQKDKLYVADMNNIKKEEYQRDEEKVAAMKKHMEEIKKIKKIKDDAAEITMHHNRNESFKICVDVENFTICIGGRTLIDEAALKINF
jgi:hypothetical protein